MGAFLVQGRLQADINASDIVQVVAVILLMAIWAVYAPAKAAAELEPAQALRATY
jgi:ABC-type lipoprotein release transport system permease subunit